MKLKIIVKPNARKTAVEKLADGSWKVSVNAPPTEGKANEAVIEALAQHFKVPKSAVHILHGGHGRKKLVVIFFSKLSIDRKRSPF